MSINPRSQPYRLDPPANEQTLPTLVTNADEMFQMLFEDIGALDAAIDAVEEIANSANSTVVIGPRGIQGDTGDQGEQGYPGMHGIQGIQGPMGFPGMPGLDGDSGDSGWCSPISATGFVPYVGAVSSVNLGLFDLSAARFFAGEGTAGAPSFAFTAEPAVGFWHNAAGQVTLQGTQNVTGALVVGSSVTTSANFRSGVTGTVINLNQGDGLMWLLKNGFATGVGVDFATQSTFKVRSYDFTTDGSLVALIRPPAGTATAGTSPLKFISGSLLTSAEAGAVEFLTDAYYGTITTGAARKTFAFLESPIFTTNITSPLIIVGTGSSKISAPTDGNVLLQDNAAATFGRLQLGGTTSSFPSIKRAGAGINIRLADDSAYADLVTQNHTAEGALTANFAGGGGLIISNPTSDAGATGQSYASFQTGGSNRWYIGMSANGSTGNFDLYNNIAGAITLVVNKTTNNLGVANGGTSAPTAKIHIGAGTATASTAPLKFTAGTLLTAPEIGAVEFTDDGTTAHAYVTVRIATVVTRVQIA